jgi:hypothetical protein
MGLIYELGHLYLMLKGDESHTNIIYDEQYDNSADAKVITSIENKVASELNNGEGSRDDHGGELFWTGSPISRTETSTGKISIEARQIKRVALTALMRHLGKAIEDKAERRAFIKKTKKAIKAHLDE